MSTIVLPILGGEKFISDPRLMMTRLFQHSLMSDWSQSNVYQGQVTSLQYLLSDNTNDITGLISAVNRQFNIYYSRYFQNVKVEFNVVKPSDSNGVVLEGTTFELSVVGYYDNVPYELSQLLKVDTTSGTKRFVEALNQ